jgi:uroporphyrinogen decarboxylase
MRQAGRYMPEYRQLRKKYSFLELCHTPQIAEEVTHLPIKILGVDVAILFSDILVVPEALGMQLHFDEGKGPIIDNPVSSEKEIPNPTGCQERLSFVFEAITRLKKSLEVPLIGFAGAPFTLASYMIEGGSSKEFKKTKEWMSKSPETFKKLIEVLTSATISYLEGQQEAGIDAFQLFDSWANSLSYDQFEEFCVPSYQKIVEKSKVPTILFCKEASSFVSGLMKAKPQGISFDEKADMKSLRKKLPQTALQGNLDPEILYQPLKTIEESVKRLLDDMRGDPGFIVNLGHGIKPNMSVEAVKTFVESVKGYS